MSGTKQKYYDCFNVSTAQKAYQKQGKQRIKTTITRDCAVFTETNESLENNPEDEEEEEREEADEIGEEETEEQSDLVKLNELKKYWKKFLV